MVAVGDTVFGMCQFGAYGLAKQGLNVEQILKTYYTGIELTKMY